MGVICSKGFGDRRVEVSDKFKATENMGRKMEEYAVPERYDSGELVLSEARKMTAATPVRSTSSKVPEISSLFGRAGIAGLERAVDVLDALGSSMSNLNTGSGFVSGTTVRGNRISILSFEVANTIAKGSNLLQSLSKENVQFLKKEVLPSEGVQKLVSADMGELLAIAAFDKREELEVFSREVIRFGNLCKDPQWHKLGRYFQKMESNLVPQKISKEESEMTMHQLMSLAQNTCELYHEFHALDRYEQDCRRKEQEEEALHVNRRGEDLIMLHSELKRQRKLVRSLKKKSLWSKTLEEVMEKLVDTVTYLYQEISEAFGVGVMAASKLLIQGSAESRSLGASGLALHYANVIIQIDSVVSRPSSIPPNIRDTLYHALPNSVKTSFRSRLLSFQVTEELNASKIKAEMEKTLQWIVPMAQNTTKAHQGFGWVGEWANIGTEISKRATGQNNIARIQTLYHAKREKTDECILELVIWLHHLVSHSKHKDSGFKSSLPDRSPNRKGSLFSLLLADSKDPSQRKSQGVLEFSQEERQMLERACRRKLVPGISKSQEFAVRKKRSFRLSRSGGSSPVKKLSTVLISKPQQANILDVIDGLDRIEKFHD